MPTFLWEALTRDGVRRSGELEVSARAEMLAWLLREKLLPVSIRLKAKGKGIALSMPFGGVSVVEVILLMRHLGVMVRAGLGIVEIFNILIADSEKKPMRQFLQEAKGTLERGQPLWGVFGARPKLFPAYVVGLVRAGESSGRLDKSFDEVAAALLRDYQSRKKALSAMIYPSILLGVTFFVLVFLFFFALPKLGAAFMQSNVKLPITSRILFETSSAFGKSPGLFFSVIGACVAGVIFLLFSSPGKKVLSLVAWRVGPMRNLIKKFALSRFSRTLGGLLSAGLPAFEALDITANSTGLPLYRKAIQEARESVRKGSPIADSFRQRSDIFPQMLTSMMAVGERSGQLSSLLLTVSTFFEDDADRALQNLITLIEPVMLLFMGAMVALLAFSVIIPIFQFVSAV